VNPKCQHTLDRLINRTEAKTLIGAAVKLRYLADPNIGLACGDCSEDTDVISVQQLSVFVERLLNAN